VSRVHCHIETDAAASAAHAVPAAPGLRLTDASTWGSMVNGRKVHNATKALAPGGLLVLGDRHIRVSWRPVCLCCSRVDPSGRAFIASIAAKLGVHVTHNWSGQVTHLAMSKITFTPKFLLALAYRVPVIVPLWLNVRSAHPPAPAHARARTLTRWRAHTHAATASPGARAHGPSLVCARRSAQRRGARPSAPANSLPCCYPSSRPPCPPPRRCSTTR
jgi:hypothetical protein